MSIIADILKEIPLSAVLKERLSEAESKMAALEKENTLLKAENATLRMDLTNARDEIKRLNNRPKPAETKPLSEQEIKVLTVLNEHGESDFLHASQISSIIGLDVPRTTYVMDCLVKSGHIRSTDYSPPGYKITHKGRDALYGPLA
jgi:hypothetical protein